MRPFFAKLRLFEFMQNFDINVPMRILTSVALKYFRSYSIFILENFFISYSFDIHFEKKK